MRKYRLIGLRAIKHCETNEARACRTLHAVSSVGEKCRAFMPNPLPPIPPLAFDDELQDLLARANLALGRLDGLTAVLPDPTVFLYSYIRKEALLSSQIEGTQSSLSDLLLFENEAAHHLWFEIHQVTQAIADIHFDRPLPKWISKRSLVHDTTRHIEEERTVEMVQWNRRGSEAAYNGQAVRGGRQESAADRQRGSLTCGCEFMAASNFYYPFPLLFRPRGCHVTEAPRCNGELPTGGLALDPWAQECCRQDLGR